MLCNSQKIFCFLQKCTSVTHASRAVCDLLLGADFLQSSLDDLGDAKKFPIPLKGFFTNQNSVIAWKCPQKIDVSTQIKILAAHIDFPCFKVRQQPFLQEKFYNLLQIVPYGNPLSQSFVDVPLAISGEIFYAQKDQIDSKLICFNEPIAIIPRLAIHLNEAQDPSPETFWKAIYCGHENFFDLIAQRSGISTNEILGYQLSLYDPSPPCKMGSSLQPWVQCSRLDDLSMVYCALMAFLSSSDTDFLQIVAFFDHEEVGSVSSSGAESFILQGFLEAVTKTKIFSLADRMQIISLDVAHALHPLFADKHALENPPLLGKGPCIKVESNMRYARDNYLAAKIQLLCQQRQIPLQIYEPKSGKPCGSTIGPILSAKLSAPCIDMGIPILGMHANREVGCWSDIVHMQNLLSAFLQQ